MKGDVTNTEREELVAFLRSKSHVAFHPNRQGFWLVVFVDDVLISGSLHTVALVWSTAPRLDVPRTFPTVLRLKHRSSDLTDADAHRSLGNMSSDHLRRLSPRLSDACELLDLWVTTRAATEALKKVVL